MKNLIFLVCFLAIIGCKNNSDKTKQNTDAIEVAKTDEVVAQKPNPIPLEKAVKKDTIRNEKNTQMNEEFFQKAVINLRDSSLSVYQNIRADYRIFGYQQPDTNSKKMIFFSVFTSDVEGNPYECPYGSYYYTSGMENNKIKYVKNVGNFVQANLIKDKTELLTPIYILKNWVEFEDVN